MSPSPRTPRHQHTPGSPGCCGSLPLSTSTRRLGLEAGLQPECRAPVPARWTLAPGVWPPSRGSARLCPRLVPWPLYFTRADKARNSLRCHSGERGGSQNCTERPAGPRLGGDGPGTRTPAVWQPHGNETILAKKLGRQWKAGAAGCWGRVAGVTPLRDPLGTLLPLGKATACCWSQDRAPPARPREVRT